MRDNVMKKNKEFVEKEEQMKKAIMELVKNYDFESVNDFYDCLHDNKEGVLEHLKWRAAGGSMKDEELSEQYVKACNKLIEEIEKEPVKEVTHQEAARIYFDLPRMEKEEFLRTVAELRKNGLKVDTKTGQWYVNEDADLSKFEKYLPKEAIK